VLTEFQQLIDADPVMRMYVHQMIAGALVVLAGHHPAILPHKGGAPQEGSARVVRDG
jgi:hypothetical protein